MIARLHARGPHVDVGVGARAVDAHVRLDDVLHHKRLLQDGAVHDLRLDRQLHLEPPRVRLGPHKASVDQLYLRAAAALAATAVSSAGCTLSRCAHTTLFNVQQASSRLGYTGRPRPHHPRGH